MKRSLIENESYLGPFDHPTKLKIGETQRIHFIKSDSGPFYLNDKEKHERRHSIVVGTKMEFLTIPTMI